MSGDDAQLAVDLAVAAGQVLMGIRAEADGAGHPMGADLGRFADAAAQACLSAGLADHRPGDSILSEEAPDDAARLRANRVWIIDPLDGTREFTERDGNGRWRDDFAVHVALWSRDHGLVAGAVAVPARGRVYRSDRSGPIPRGESLPTGSRPLRVAVSRTRPPAFMQTLAASGDVELVPMGSAGIKAVAVVEGEVDAYVHAGGLNEWDAAAPVAVALGAGLTATRLDGSSLAYNCPVPWVPDLVVCHPAAREALDRVLATRARN